MNTPDHCLDGPGDLAPKPEKVIVRVNNIEELERMVNAIIDSGRVDIKLDFSPALLLEPGAYDILERIVSDHPESQAKLTEEIVSYAEGSLAEQNHRGFSYQVFESVEGYRVKVDHGCQGWQEPFDCAFEDIAAADEHGIAYIDSIILQAEESARRKKSGEEQ